MTNSEEPLGEYVCHAKNAVGEIHSSATVQVHFNLVRKNASQLYTI